MGRIQIKQTAKLILSKLSSVNNKNHFPNKRAIKSVTAKTVCEIVLWRENYIVRGSVFSTPGCLLGPHIVIDEEVLYWHNSIGLWRYIEIYVFKSATCHTNHNITIGFRLEFPRKCVGKMIIILKPWICVKHGTTARKSYPMDFECSLRVVENWFKSWIISFSHIFSTLVPSVSHFIPSTSPRSFYKVH